MKELYQQAVADSERITKINAAEEIQHATNARSIKERFERGEPIAAMSDDEQDAISKTKAENQDEEILAAGTCYFMFKNLYILLRRTELLIYYVIIFKLQESLRFQALAS